MYVVYGGKLDGKFEAISSKKIDFCDIKLEDFCQNSISSIPPGILASEFAMKRLSRLAAKICPEISPQNLLNSE